MAMETNAMEKAEFYRRNQVDCYALLYFPKDKTGVAYHLPIPAIGSKIGVGQPALIIENVKSRKNAIKILRETVDRLPG